MSRRSRLNPVATAGDLAVNTSMTRRGSVQRNRPVQQMLGYFGSSSHGWGLHAVGGTCVNDTSVTGLGTQSIKMQPLASNNCWIDSPDLSNIDLTNKLLRLWFRYTGGITSIMVQPSNTTDFSNNRAQFSFLDSGYTSDSQDAVVDIPISEFVSNVGTFDKTAMTKIRIVANGDASATGICWAQGLAIVSDAVSTLPNGCVIFSADDSFKTQLTFMAPNLARYGYAATLYPMVSALTDGSGSHMTVDDALTLQNVFGWDIGYHALDQDHHADHSGWTEAQLRAHFEAIIAQQTAWGFRGRSFAWPLSQSSVLSRRVAADYFTTSRGGSTVAPETFPPVQPQNFRSINSGGGAKSLAQLKAYVDRAKAGHCAVHFLFHDFTTSGSPAANQNIQSEFTDLVDYIAAQGVPVYTQSQYDTLAIQPSTTIRGGTP